MAGAHFICRLTDRPASCRCHPNPPLHPPSSISRLQHCKSYSYSVHTGMLNPEVNPTYAEYFDRGVLSSVYLLPAAIIRQGGDWDGGADQTLWLQKHVRHLCCVTRHLCCITRHLCRGILICWSCCRSQGGETMWPRLVLFEQTKYTHHLNM